MSIDPARLDDEIFECAECDTMTGFVVFCQCYDEGNYTGELALCAACFLANAKTEGTA